MSLQGKKSLNIFIVFIVILVYTETVESNINYSEIRHDVEPQGDQAEGPRTTREILEMFSNRANYQPVNNFQQATEHLLQFGALLRIQILDIFGPLVYDHYDDYSIDQTEALYRVYQETLERKYNIFQIVPSVLRDPDLRPTKICRHIHKHVHTCLKESSLSCMTITKHNQAHLRSSLSPALNITRRMYKQFHMKKKFPNGFSLPAILDHLKSGSLHLTVGLMSGLLHNIQYDSFDDEVRTAERNVMIMLTSEMLGSDQDEVLMEKNRLWQIRTVSDLLKELFDLRKNMRRTMESNKNFAILSEHVVREVEAISKNIELLGTVYDNSTIDMKYLLDLILPRDVVDEDITDAKTYLLKKISDYDIVSKYLKVEKYQQSGPEQLLMEILGQMRDIDFAVDIATALHVHARFWRQSHMINNLNELLELFDAYKNLANVPQYSGLMSLTDKIRNTLWNSKNVTVEILCNNPRVCLRLGLEIVAKCEFINAGIKKDIGELFYHLQKSEVIHDDKCTLLMNSVKESNESQATPNPPTITNKAISDLTNLEEIVTTDVYTAEPTSVESEKTSKPTINAEETTVVPTTEENAATSTATEIPTELPAINTDDTTRQVKTLTMEDATETTEQQTTDFTDSKDSMDEELTTTPVSTEEPVTPDVSNELTTETQAAEDQAIEELRTTAHTTVEPTLQDTTTTEQTFTGLAEQTTTEKELSAQKTMTAEHRTSEEETTTQEATTTEQTTTEEESSTQKTTTTERMSEILAEQSTTEKELSAQRTMTTEQRTSEEEITTQEETTTEQTSTESTRESTTEVEITTEPTETTTTTSGESTTEMMIADETIIPWSDNDCYGNGCTPEILNDSTDILSSHARHTDHNSLLPLSSYSGRATKSIPAPTTTAILTARENSITSTTVPEVITASPSSLTSGNTTSIGKKPGLSKKPESYSASFSAEKCSGGACTSDDCSGKGCRPHPSPEVINNSTDCSGTNCNITGQTNCNGDGSCPPASSTDKCNGSDCKSSSNAARVFQSIEKSEGDECFNCVDDNCSEVSKNNESPCSDNDCVNSNERRPSTAMQKSNPALSVSAAQSVRCDNKDPHHQRQLEKLKKIRIMNALHGTPPARPGRSNHRVKDGDSSNELPSSRLAPRVATKSQSEVRYQNLPPWLRFSQDKISGASSPWRRVSQDSIQAHNIEEEEFGHQSIESEMVRTKNRTKTKAYRNRNTNINFISLRRYIKGNIGGVVTPKSPILQKVEPNSSYRRVVTRISNGLGSGKWVQKPQHESEVNLELKASSEESPDISGRHEVSLARMKPAVYQTKESDDNIKRMRRNRSIIRAPQRASRRYLR